MFESLVGSFLSSAHGQGAAQALAENGVAPDMAQSLLGQALPAVGNILHPAAAGSSGGGGLLGGLLGGHEGSNFLMGAVGGLLGGHGLTGALEDGALSAVSGRVAQIAAEHLGVNPDMASRIAAAATPFLVSFVKEKLAHHQSQPA
jgi:hypothetical protein